MGGLDGERAAPGWLLDELASAGRENLDPDHVERYDGRMDARAAEEAYHFSPDEADERVEAWCAPHGNEVAGEWARWELEEHVRDEHSTFTWLLEAMFEQTGFSIEVAGYSDDGFDSRYVLRSTVP